MKKEINVQTHLISHEILFPASTITIETSAPLDARSAQSGIVVSGERGIVKLSNKDKTATWSPAKKLKAGSYQLIINEILSKEGEGLKERVEIPFYVVESQSKIPEDHYVESMVRMRINEVDTCRLDPLEKADGKFLEIFKLSHRKTQAQLELAFNEKGEKVDKTKIFHDLRQNYVEKYGKIHPTLFNAMSKLNKSEPIEVAIWLNSPDTEEIQDELKLRKENSSKAPVEVLRRQNEILDTTKQFYQKLNDELEYTDFERKSRVDPFVPVVYTQLNLEEIKDIADSDEVLALFLYESEGIEDLSDSIAIANSNDVHSLGQKGAGVRVAVWENGPDDASELIIQAFFDPAQTNTSDHSRHTHAIIKNNDSGNPKGHAPSCILYSANNKSLSALAWAAKERGCTVISQSFHRASEPGSPTLSFDDIYKDWLALQWPFPTILQAAGNFWEDDPDNIDPPESEYVNHKGYNSLAVGNHNDSADAMSGSSVFRNPSTSHGDRELPEICANGMGVSTVNLTKSGTSMAAPAVAGVTALIQGENSILKSWPEGCRAILLAGAKRNIQDNTWWRDVINNVDAADGTGAVDALESFKISQNRRNRNTSPTQRGWDVGLLRSNDFQNNGLSNFSYRIKVPSGLWGPRHVKVALAWSSKIGTLWGLPFSSQLAVDLDLKIYDSNNNQVGYSGSWDNSYEIAEFKGIPGKTYYIRIRRWSGTDNTWFGLAWTVSGGLLVGTLVDNINHAISESFLGTDITLRGGYTLGT